MKKHFLIALVLLCSVFVVPSFAQDLTYVEHISEFNSEIVINEDASIDIVEEIHYHFPMERRGIYWTYPVDYSVQGFKRATSFKMNDIYYYPAHDSTLQESHFEKVGSTAGWIEYRIGQEDVYLTGEYVYVIDYTIKDVGVSYFDEHDEVYLNIIGPGWEVPILQSTATITTPVEDTNRVCYTGPESFTATDCTMSSTEDGMVITTDKMLDSYSAFTLALAFPVGTIENHTGDVWLQLLIANLGVLIPIPVIILLVKKAKKYKNKKITIIPHYDAPEDLDPMLAGYVFKKKYDPKHLTALIIWMAVKGYISVEREGSVSYLIKEVDKIENESKYITKLFESMFSKKKRVSVSKMPVSFSNKIISTVSLVNNKTRSEGYIEKERVDKKGMFTTLGWILGMSAFFVLLPFLMVYAAAGTGWGLVISGVAMAVVGSKIDIRGVEGNKLYYQLLGLKMYINTAEKHRIEFHNDPEKFRGVFETLLPYAIIFGLEKKWAKEFEDLYKDTPPSWYRGDVSNFTPYMISNSIHGLSSGIKAANTKAYGSSSGYRSSGWSSGGSGFSGGSSGGGGGGSGGGSW
ncbi:DUF2207 domain-containing protein [bacterium]|nr:DUF2207 domain-containing protein [bacterium]